MTAAPYAVCPQALEFHVQSHTEALRPKSQSRAVQDHVHTHAGAVPAADAINMSLAMSEEELQAREAQGWCDGSKWHHSDPNVRCTPR